MMMRGWSSNTWRISRSELYSKISMFWLSEFCVPMNSMRRKSLIFLSLSLSFSLLFERSNVFEAPGIDVGHAPLNQTWIVDVDRAILDGHADKLLTTMR